MPLLMIVSFLIVLAIPVALFMIWAQLGHLNEQLRIRQVIEDARLATAERPPTSPRQRSVIRQAVEHERCALSGARV